MVTTRSQSRLSGASSLSMDNAVDSSNAHAEVTSRRCAAKVDDSPPLQVILEEEEEEKKKKTRVKKSTASTTKETSSIGRRADSISDDRTEMQAHHDDMPEQVPEGVSIESLADAIIQALQPEGQEQDGTGPSDSSGGSDSSDRASSSSEDEEGHEDPEIDERRLRWHPELALPEEDEGRSLGSASLSKREKSDANGSIALLEGKKGALSKGVFVPTPDERARARAVRSTAPDTAGKDWFGLPATSITDEVKADLRVLRLRSALDPKQFYKKFDDTKFPKYFQFGTVIEGPTEWHSSRLSKKQRKRTLAEEVMVDDHLTKMRKKRYNKLQEAASQWSTKNRGRKTDNPRIRPKPRRPKH